MAEAANFLLLYDVPETPNAQGGWRFCSKCHSMFFNGYHPNAGRCMGGGGHTAQGFNFVLPHDFQLPAYHEKDWRFCNKCFSLFRDQHQNQGRCAAGGAHAAQGFNFVLHFRGNLAEPVGRPARN